MRKHRIAAIPADGIGPEVISAGIEVLEALAANDGGFAFDFEHFDWGSARYKSSGQLMPADGAEQLKAFDAIFFGAVGAPDVADVGASGLCGGGGTGYGGGPGAVAATLAATHRVALFG